MNPELEAVLQALEAFKEEPSAAEVHRLKEIYEARFNEVLQKHPGLSRERLQQAIRFAYSQRLKARKTHSSVPPKA